MTYFKKDLLNFQYDKNNQDILVSTIQNKK